MAAYLDGAAESCARGVLPDPLVQRKHELAAEPVLAVVA